MKCPLEILFIDNDVIVVNKPAGVPCHPLREEETNTVLHLVGEQYPEVLTASSNPLEGGLCHRLDNDTSGALAFARTKDAHETIRAAFQQSKVKRVYIALLQGELNRQQKVDVPIAHHNKNARKMLCVTSDMRHYRGQPKDAWSEFTPIVSSQKATLTKVVIQGGRRHQVRVHAAFFGHPLVGDVLYGGPKANYLPGHALHAAALTLPGKPTISAGLPVDFINEIENYGILGRDFVLEQII